MSRAWCDQRIVITNAETSTSECTRRRHHVGRHRGLLIATNGPTLWTARISWHRPWKMHREKTPVTMTIHWDVIEGYIERGEQMPDQRVRGM